MTLSKPSEKTKHQFILSYSDLYSQKDRSTFWQQICLSEIQTHIRQFKSSMMKLGLEELILGLIELEASIKHRLYLYWIFHDHSSLSLLTMTQCYHEILDSFSWTLCFQTMELHSFFHSIELFLYYYRHSWFSNEPLPLTFRDALLHQLIQHILFILQPELTLSNLIDQFHLFFRQHMIPLQPIWSDLSPLFYEQFYAIIEIPILQRMWQQQDLFSYSHSQMLTLAFLELPSFLEFFDHQCLLIQDIQEFHIQWFCSTYQSLSLHEPDGRLRSKIQHWIRQLPWKRTHLFIFYEFGFSDIPSFHSIFFSTPFSFESQFRDFMFDTIQLPLKSRSIDDQGFDVWISMFEQYDSFLSFRLKKLLREFRSPLQSPTISVFIVSNTFEYTSIHTLYPLSSDWIQSIFGNTNHYRPLLHTLDIYSLLNPSHGIRIHGWLSQVEIEIVTIGRFQFNLLSFWILHYLWSSPQSCPIQQVQTLFELSLPLLQRILDSLQQHHLIHIQHSSHMIQWTWPPVESTLRSIEFPSSFMESPPSALDLLETQDKIQANFLHFLKKHKHESFSLTELEQTFPDLQHFITFLDQCIDREWIQWTDDTHTRIQYLS